MSQYAPEDYGMNIVYSTEDESYVATSPEFPAMTGFGETQEEAFADLHEVLAATIEIHEREGYPLPAPQKALDIVLPSGEFRVRISRVVHYQLTMQAAHESVSLNHLVSNLLQDGLTRRALFDQEPASERRALPEAEDHNGRPEAYDPAGSVTQRLPPQEFPGGKPQSWNPGPAAELSDNTDMRITEPRRVN